MKLLVHSELHRTRHPFPSACNPAINISLTTWISTNITFYNTTESCHRLQPGNTYLYLLQSTIRQLSINNWQFNYSYLQQLHYHSIVITKHKIQCLIYICHISLPSSQKRASIDTIFQYSSIHTYCSVPFQCYFYINCSWNLGKFCPLHQSVRIRSQTQNPALFTMLRFVTG